MADRNPNGSIKRGWFCHKCGNNDFIRGSDEKRYCRNCEWPAIAYPKKRRK